MRSGRHVNNKHIHLVLGHQVPPVSSKKKITQLQHFFDESIIFFFFFFSQNLFCASCLFSSFLITHGKILSITPFIIMGPLQLIDFFSSTRSAMDEMETPWLRAGRIMPCLAKCKSSGLCPSFGAKWMGCKVKFSHVTLTPFSPSPMFARTPWRPNIPGMLGPERSASRRPT